MQARKRAPQTISQKKKLAGKVIQPAERIKQIWEIMTLACGIFLLFGGTFALGSLFFNDMNSATFWLAEKMRFLFGKTAGFTSLVAILAGIWILFLRKIEKPFSFSFPIFVFFTMLYIYGLMLIQRFTALQAPFVDAAAGGGILGEKIDTFLVNGIGGGGTLILLFFIGAGFLLIAWRFLTRTYPEKIQQNMETTTEIIEKAKSMFSVTPAVKTEKTLKEFKQPLIDDLSEETINVAMAEADVPKKKTSMKDRLLTVTGLAGHEGADDFDPENGDGKRQNAKPFRTLFGKQEEPVSSAPAFKPVLSHKITFENLNQPQKAAPDNWRLPQLDEIFDPAKPKKMLSADDPHIRTQVMQIEQVLETFAAPGKVVDIQCGPTFTQFGVEPGFLEKGDRRTRVRVKQIETLQKDLEMALSVKQLTIEAPIPGKTYIGLQVQNRVRVPVTIREALNNDEFSRAAKKLPIVLGKDINGDVITSDLTRLPHLLIAGTTGSGKSVCLNAILACLLLYHSPDSLKLVLIDPKRVELTGYNGIPHLITPVVTDVTNVGKVLQWTLAEMDQRNLKFLESGVRNIQDFNQKYPDKKMPYLVVVIDELANLMMEAASDVESSITRLAQTARAMGIHLVVATQRPSRDVITGTIEGNLPSRIAFAVATSVDSMVILDRPGAENLFGKGDMYLMSAEETTLKRLQCVYVSDAEIKRLVEYWRKNPKLTDAETPNTQSSDIQPVTVRRIPTPQSGILTQLPLLDEDEPAMKKTEDVLLEDAITLARSRGKVSANMLVSQFGIGFTRANKLLVQMEDRGIISPPNANPALPREILDYGEQTPANDDSPQTG